MTTITSEQSTIPESTGSVESVSPMGSLAKDVQSLPSGTKEVETPPMLEALQQLLMANEKTLRQVSQLLPPQSLSYLSLMMLEMVELHLKKAAGYSGLDTPDTWRNFRRSENLGIPPVLGVLNRKGDKVSRYENLVRDSRNDQLGNESLRTTLRDDAAYALIAICLQDEIPSVSDKGNPNDDPETVLSGRMRHLLLHETAGAAIGE